MLFDASAIAWTEAPATVRGLAKQRFRWAFGTLQCLWKYRAMTFNPRYRRAGNGRVAAGLDVPDISHHARAGRRPDADLAASVPIYRLAQHGSEFNDSNLVTVGIYYVVFMVVDLLAACSAF